MMWPGCVVDDNRKEASCVTVAGSGGTQFHRCDRRNDVSPQADRARPQGLSGWAVRVCPVVSSEKEKFAASVVLITDD